MIAAAPAFAGSKKSQNVKNASSDDSVIQARLAEAAAAEEGNSPLADEASTSLTVNENADEAAATTAEASANEETKALSQAEIKNMKESEIPLIGAGKQQKKSESSPWFRLITTIGVLGILFVAARYGLKKYTRRSNNTSKNQGTKIRVVTNHHIGPKRSLMIVNVAGESLLLGVTDQNISILKNLSLLEEELPADVPSTFAGAINETFVETKNLAAAKAAITAAAEDNEDDFAVQGLAQIKDKVSSRLKNMRQI